MARRSPIAVHIPDLTVSPPRHHSDTSPMPVVFYDRNGDIMDTVVLATNSVEFFSDLPAADGSNIGEFWIVKKPQGTWLLGTKKRSGHYLSDGVTWTKLSILRINDTTISTETLWSSTKIDSAVTTGSTYTHTQAIAANTWNINHALNRFPSVTIVDGSGDICEAHVNYFDSDNIIITFEDNQTGKVYLN